MLKNLILIIISLFPYFGKGTLLLNETDYMDAVKVENQSEKEESHRIRLIPYPMYSL